MSIRRLAGTALAMTVTAVALSTLTPDLASMTRDLAAAQHTVDTAGADALVVSTAGLLAWAVWGWGALGLALTAASAAPGLAGSAARIALHVVLPAGARRSAALALGLGLGVAGPLLGAASLLTAGSAAAASVSTVGDVPDWPVPAAAHLQATPVPDWPTGEPPAGSHVVVRGDCLWHIAVSRLTDRHSQPPTDGEVAHEVHAWWTANADVIGPDPDLLLPGQVLIPPPQP